MKAEDHAQWVGAIVTNLAALETVLRRFLVEARRQDAPFPRAGDRDAKKSYLTSYLMLDEIIKKYRNTLRADEAKFQVDTKVVRIRDAFAHGRMVTEKGLPFHLWKFGRASRGRVPVEFSKELTVEWLKETALMIEGEKDKVVECFKRRDYKGLS